MNFKKKIEQYSVLIVGLMIGGGFAFGGIASYAGMVGGGQSQNGDTDTSFNASLPGSFYQESSFDMSPREQAVAASENQVVFVNTFYDNMTQYRSLQGLKDITSEYDNRVYVSVVNSSTPDPVLNQYGFNTFPRAVVVGDKRSQPLTTVMEPSRENIGDSICSVMSSWDGLAAKCSGIR